MRKLLFKCMRYSGLPWVFRELIQKNKISILLFHDISPEIAEKSFLYLQENYNLIDLNFYIDALYSEGVKEIPKKALVITFDDGHVNNFKILPIIKKYNIPVTIFLCSSIINTKRQFWFKYEKLNHSCEDLKRMSNQERLNIMALSGFYKDKEYENIQSLNQIQIQEMSKFVNMQSHTMFHPCLPKCTDDEAKMELFNSKTKLEDDYGLDINTISYPNGDYSSRDIKLSKMAGYKCGITVDHGYNSVKSDPFKLKRLSVNDTNDLNELVIKSSGLWSFITTLNGHFQNHGFTE